MLYTNTHTFVNTVTKKINKKNKNLTRREKYRVIRKIEKKFLQHILITLSE